MRPEWVNKWLNSVLARWWSWLQYLPQSAKYSFCTNFHVTRYSVMCRRLIPGHQNRPINEGNVNGLFLCLEWSQFWLCSAIFTNTVNSIGGTREYQQNRLINIPVYAEIHLLLWVKSGRHWANFDVMQLLLARFFCKELQYWISWKSDVLFTCSYEVTDGRGLRIRHSFP